MRRDSFEEADNDYWAAMRIVAVEAPGNSVQKAAMAKRYAAANARALAIGFVYKPVSELANPDNIDDVVARLMALKQSEEGEVQRRQAEAILGGVDSPKTTVSEALEVYFNEIAVDDQLGKSKRQAYQWKKVKRLSASYFIDVVGDLPLVDITREHALKYQRWWRDRMLSPAEGEKAVSPNTINRHIGNIRVLYRSYFTHIGEEERPNPFRNLFFKARSRVEVPAFEDDWVRTKILKPGGLLGLRPELQLITYMLIETGCRPSELINLRPEDIHLEDEVPYISIKPSTIIEMIVACCNHVSSIVSSEFG